MKTRPGAMLCAGHHVGEVSLHSSACATSFLAQRPPPGSLSLSSACQCFWIVWWFHVVDKCPVFTWTKTPNSFCFESQFSLQPTSSEAKGILTHFSHHLVFGIFSGCGWKTQYPPKAGHRHMLWLMHSELLRFNGSERVGLTQLDRDSGNRATMDKGEGGLQCLSLGVTVSKGENQLRSRKMDIFLSWYNFSLKEFK